ncbi:hypothetical protein BO83DRAFT_427209 [Aspergillus eucalypticola CBS 122712]|uniref:Transcription factor domain-containing protein n=1 Tax=Aspergillus eucalypticola (strain CBS 122712 / IBT 29274) TaxID=1448314 RepID=A0A317VI62_ASPEC|nr:uncharacterized protein BO83DRAFT_427209 [Aspergillus eucalypticola CBS 122712]PWY72572.1 hypothetical protein BO83DRAFT_427209 [Aspergillus eucalypticola CBS 122712]
MERQLADLQDQVNVLFRDRSLSGQEMPSMHVASSYNMSLSDRDQSPKRTSRSPSNTTHDKTLDKHSVCSPALSDDSPWKEPKESDTLGLTTPSLNTLPIGSQIIALRKLRQATDIGDLGNSCQPALVPVTLPEFQQFWELWGVFFTEFESYFPCLNQAVIMERFSATLFSRGYGDGVQQIYVGPADCKIIAILLNMLAYAESLTQPAEPCEPQRFPQSYLQGLKLMQHFDKLHDCDLENVLYHTTSSTFLLEMSQHHLALQSTTQGFQIALKIGLNNPALWPDVDSDLVSRQGLWWTLYFLDKRLTQKCGITYFLREDESYVNDAGILNGNMGSRRYHLLQSLVSFSRLWAHIWDAFFSPQAPKLDYWQEMQMTDTRIVLSYRQLPWTLHWKSSMATEYLSLEGQTHTRQRLVIYLRFQTLRLSIRHKPLTSTEYDIERRRTSISICEAITEAIRQYMAISTSLKPFGYMLTTALVECLYHVVPEESCSSPITPRKALRGIVLTTSQLLRTLSRSTAMAYKVYQYLQDILPIHDTVATCHDLSESSVSQNIDQQIPQDCPMLMDMSSEDSRKALGDGLGQDSTTAFTNSGSMPPALELPDFCSIVYSPSELEGLQRQSGMDLGGEGGSRLIGDLL